MNRIFLNQLSLFVCLLLLSVNINCSKKDVKSKENEHLNPVNGAAAGNRGPILPGNKLEKPLASKHDDVSKSSSTSATASSTSYSCGSSLNSTYYGSGFYRYPDYSLNLGAVPEFSTIN